MAPLKRMLVLFALGGLAGACSERTLTTANRVPLTPHADYTHPANGSGACMGTDAFNSGFTTGMSDTTNLNCTANDISIADAVITSYKVNAGGTFQTLSPGSRIQCTAGDTIYAVTDAHLQNNAQSRYDIGIWIATDGGNAINGTCNHYNLIPGQGGAVSLEAPPDSDACGDMAQGAGLVTVPLDTLKIPCVAGTDTVKVGACLGWQNSDDTGSFPYPSQNGRGLCPTTPPGGALGFRYGTVPETKSKCNCSPFPLPIDVRGEITIVKNVIGGNGTFLYSQDVGSNSNPVVNNPFGITTVAGTGQQQFLAVAGGTYHVTEQSLSSDFAFVSLVCSTGGSVSGQTATITISQGNSVTCTFTNRKQPKLTLVKRVINDNGGTATVSDFGLSTTAGSLTFDGGVADGTSTLKYTSNVFTLNPGSYSLHEGTLTGYTEGTWSCTAGSVTNSTPAGGSVTLAAGDSAVCTITNNDQGAKLVLVKNVVNDNGGTATVSSFGISTTAGALTFGAASVSGSTSTYTSGVLNVNAGSYTLHENTLTGYSEGNWSCSKGLASGDPQNGSVTLGIGDSVTCSITNNDIPGQLTLVKNIVNAYGGTATVSAFGITTNAGSLAFGAASVSGNTSTYTAGALTVNAGTYSLHEGTVNGYTDGTWSCNKGLVSSNPQTGSVTVGLADTITCSITNSDQPATLKVVKVVKGAGATFAFNGTGTGVSTSFNLNPPSNAADTIVFANIAAGVKTVTEILQGGYLLTDLGCSNQPLGQYDAAVTQTVTDTVHNGETVTCTFINQQNAQTTRTQGFWATHLSLTNAVWFGGTVGGNTFAGVSTAGRQFCSPVTKDLETIGEVMGGFWSSIPQTSTGSKRSSLDQARMQLMQQLLAAILNNAAFGSSPTLMSIDQAKAAYCGNSQTAIQSALQAMASFNTSGDNGVFTPGVSANGKQAKAAANIPYWDVLP